MPDSVAHTSTPELVALRQLRAAVLALDGETDLSSCPYYDRYESLPGHDPQGQCGFDCNDEPACITDCPREGWPLAIAKHHSGLPAPVKTVEP